MGDFLLGMGVTDLMGRDGAVGFADTDTIFDADDLDVAAAAAATETSRCSRFHSLRARFAAFFFLR